MSGKRYVYHNGVFVPQSGKSAVQLPQHLRVLPGEFVTRDIEDPDKIHELDPDHIVDDLKQKLEAKYIKPPDPKTVKEQERKERLNAAIQPIPIGEKAPVTQPRVDAARLRVLRSFIDEAYQLMLVQQDYSVYLRPHYLWFPDRDNVNEVELRMGNPPADRDRPKHLRGLELVVDVQCWPPAIKARLAEYGVSIPSIDDMKLKYDKEMEDAERPAAKL